MTLPKKKSRSITVDDQTYRYLIAKRDTNLNLTVEAENAQSQLITFYVQYSSPWLNFSVERVTGEKQPANEIESITPAFVRKVILFAIENGWQLGVKEKPMQIVLEEGNLKQVHPPT